jgi:Mce-associated membrane protein
MTTTVPGTPPAVPPSGPAVSDAPGPFTPERPRAAWGNRALAVLLDSAVVASVAFLAAGDTSPFYSVPLHGVDDATTAGSPWAVGTLLALGVLQAYTGMTPGKRVAGIAVVDAGSGRPVGFLGTVLRWLAHVVDAILFVGYLRAAFHREGRTFADSLLGTVAVRTTTPEPHPWVARARRARDARTPWLRWPRRVTGGVALVLCAAAAAMSLVQGSSGGTTTAATESTCDLGDPASPYLALIGSSFSEMRESRAGISRPSEQSWRAVVAWSSATAGATPGWSLPAESQATLTLRSPDGTAHLASEDTSDPFGPDGPWWSMPGDEIVSATVTSPTDLSGWTATATLTDAEGGVLAACSGAVPHVDPASSRW